MELSCLLEADNSKDCLVASIRGPTPNFCEGMLQVIDEEIQEITQFYGNVKFELQVHDSISNVIRGELPSFWKYESTEQGWASIQGDSSKILTKCFISNFREMNQDDPTLIKCKHVMTKLENFQFSKIKNAWAVYNPTLVNLFISERDSLHGRQISAPSSFLSTTWSQSPHLDQRKLFFQDLQNFTQSFEWNQGKLETLPCIPMLQGTIEEFAWSIAKNGFGIACKLDSGWYGQGMYFTRNFDWSSYYARLMKHKISRERKISVPATNFIVVALVTPGNTFPVVNEYEFAAKPCNPGYQSHYTIVTSQDGPEKGKTIKGNQLNKQTQADELVVFQSGQALPIFIIETA